LSTFERFEMSPPVVYNCPRVVCRDCGMRFNRYSQVPDRAPQRSAADRRQVASAARL